MKDQRGIDFGPHSNRRRFLRQTAATAAVVAGLPLLGRGAFAPEAPAELAIVVDPTEPICRQAPVRWAVGELGAALQARGVTARVHEALAEVTTGAHCVYVTGRESGPARELLAAAGLAVAATPEALGMVRGTVGGRAVLLVCGADLRGVVYTVLDLVDRVNCAEEPLAGLAAAGPVAEQPANRIRSVARFFVSDVEDKGWFNDRDFWRRYLTMLATQRFNRFSLTLGIGYDFTSGIRDCYFHFAYPFLLQTPGYEVRAVGLPDPEREANLAMLKFIGEETVRRGLHFQLGLWTHAYQWTNSPQPNYTIAGLTPETHAAYCRDSLRLLLRECPAISGVTLRVHGESGVAEGSYDFWKTLFDGVAQCGRRVEIDMHAKGMDQPTIDAALATGMPVNISPKFWAEHLGLPYMQAAIRPLEMPAPDSRDNGFFAKSNGSRKFLRYGYGDLLAEDRKYGVLHRVWPGTQRLLLWGDPVTAAAYARNFSFCGSDGVEWCEPLSFKGRKGSGLPGSRDGYAEAALQSPGGGWEKYRHTYRLWGRLAYNPQADGEVGRRFLRQGFGAAAGPAEAALAAASRILPLITTAHLPSAANNNYWPEVYTNMSIPDARKPHPYGDTLSPKRFGAVSPLDPELFSRIDDFAQELLEEKATPKYSPVDVAGWLTDLAETAREQLHRAEAACPGQPTAEFRRWAVDIAIQSGLGHFFARKFRAGVLYAVHEKSGDREALAEAVKEYRAARVAWAAVVDQAAGIYAKDLTFGLEPQLRGTWADRLPAIDEDIGELERRLAALPTSAGGKLKFEPQVVARAIQAGLTLQRRTAREVGHRPLTSFRRGEKIELAVDGGPFGYQLHYRRVNQAEAWRSAGMVVEGNLRVATIPAEYTDSPFPIQYYFEVRAADGSAGLYPGFDDNRANQPYFVLRQEKR